MTSEVLGAIITVGGTVVLAVFQTTRALKEQAKLNAAPELAKLRYPAYEGLWNITDVGPEHGLKNLETRAERETIADAMTRWYYPNGLALSGPSQRQWQRVRDLLRQGDKLDEGALTNLRDEISLLRSWLKADLFIRTVDEVSVAAKELRQPTIREEAPRG